MTIGNYEARDLLFRECTEELKFYVSQPEFLVNDFDICDQFPLHKLSQELLLKVLQQIMPEQAKLAERKLRKHAIKEYMKKEKDTLMENEEL